MRRDPVVPLATPTPTPDVRCVCGRRLRFDLMWEHLVAARNACDNPRPADTA